jgi:hypothetical protein
MELIGLIPGMIDMIQSMIGGAIGLLINPTAWANIVFGLGPIMFGFVKDILLSNVVEGVFGCGLCRPGGLLTPAGMVSILLGYSGYALRLIEQTILEVICCK